MPMLDVPIKFEPNPEWPHFKMWERIDDIIYSIPAGQVLFLVEIIEAGGFNQQQARLASLYRVSSPSAVRA